MTEKLIVISICNNFCLPLFMLIFTCAYKFKTILVSDIPNNTTRVIGTWKSIYLIAGLNKVSIKYLHRYFVFHFNTNISEFVANLTNLSFEVPLFLPSFVHIFHYYCWKKLPAPALVLYFTSLPFFDPIGCNGLNDKNNEKKKRDVIKIESLF